MLPDLNDVFNAWGIGELDRAIMFPEGFSIEGYAPGRHDGEDIVLFKVKEPETPEQVHIFMKVSDIEQNLLSLKLRGGPNAQQNFLQDVLRAVKSMRAGMPPQLIPIENPTTQETLGLN